MSAQTNERRILVTGGGGFIARNLVLGLSERRVGEVRTFERNDPADALDPLVSWADVVVHLAGVNRPPSEQAFQLDNVDLTQRIADVVARSNRGAHIIFASTVQAGRDTPYGTSKRAAEQVLERLHEMQGTPISILRLPNVFGKWSRPHYNSVVATFCAAVARGEPLHIDDPAASVRLVYIDDLVASVRALIADPPTSLRWPAIEPIYAVTVGDLADIIRSFSADETGLAVERVGSGLRRGLYATYLSHLAPDRFSYPLSEHRDHRGTFVEVVKTPDCGQVSFFSSRPGVVRGGHYHHTKTEKFVVVRGRARFRSRNLQNGDYTETEASADNPHVVQTIPGWVHDVVNVGDEDLLVMVWANEVFDRKRPDTEKGEVDE